METTATKICNKCHKELPVTEFHKKAKAKDGLQSECKTCRKQYYPQKSSVTPPHTHHVNDTDMGSQPARVLIQQIRCLKKELLSRGYKFEGKLTYLQTIDI